MQGAVSRRFDTVSIAGVSFADTRRDEAVEWVLRSCMDTAIPKTSIRLANAWSVVLADRSPDYLALLNGEGVTFPDGASITGVMRLLRSGKYRHGQRVRGPSLFCACMDAGRRTDVRHFLLGTTDDTLQALTHELEARFPGVQIAGSFAPSFGPLDDEFVAECAKRVAEAEADLVWVALGVPKQDVLAREVSRRQNVTTVGVGAAFDMVAGNIREAPVWIQRLGIEWLFRLAVEPRRLWRRYIVGNVCFLALAWRHR